MILLKGQSRGVFLEQPRGRLFLMSEVPLKGETQPYPCTRTRWPSERGGQWLQYQANGSNVGRILRGGVKRARQSRTLQHGHHPPPHPGLSC